MATCAEFVKFVKLRRRSVCIRTPASVPNLDTARQSPATKDNISVE